MADNSSSTSHPTTRDSTDAEKVHVVENEHGVAARRDEHETALVDVDTSAVSDRRLLRKIDLALVPWLSLLYLLAFLDRTNIGNAKLYNMEADLHITDQQYLISLTVFFFTYAIFEAPSNIMLKRLSPSIWLSASMLAWGITMVCQGLVKNYGGLLVTRLLLGTFEAGLFPGVNYLLSCWYRRSEFGLRAAIFFSAATISGAFGGLLAAAISNMNGIGGKAAWAWIFIIEGLVTVVAASASFFIVQNFPDNAGFLTEPERAAVVKRLQADNQFSAGPSGLEHHFQMRYLWEAVFDMKVWLMMIVYMGADGPLYAFSLFLPSIIAALGFESTPANLLTVPVYVCACGVTCLVGFLADKHGHRGRFNLGCFVLAGAGYVILIASRSPALSYFATYLAACGIYPIVANTIAWASNNLEGSYKRGVAMAMVIGFGNINGAVSSNVYRANQAPWYRLGHIIILVYIVIGFCMTLIAMAYLNRENAARERGERDEIITGPTGAGEKAAPVDERGNGVFASVEEARRAKGDRWSGYRYTL